MSTVSTVIPVHNDAQALLGAIESALGQSSPPEELVIVDDGSNAPLARHLARYGERVVYVRQPHRGVSAARNAGIRASRGEWVAFLDADDRWRPDKLERQRRLMRGTTPGAPDCLYARYVTVAAGVRMLSRVPPRDGRLTIADLLRRNWIGTSTVVARKAALLRTGGFDETLRVCGDYDLWLRMASAGAEFAYCPEPLVTYEWSPAGLSQRLAEKEEVLPRILSRIFARPDCPPRIRGLERSALSDAYLALARAAAMQGDRRRAHRCLQRGLRLFPRNLARPEALALVAGILAGRSSLPIARRLSACGIRPGRLLPPDD